MSLVLSANVKDFTFLFQIQFRKILFQQFIECKKVKHNKN
jgi:hypothetical protein